MAFYKNDTIPDLEGETWQEIDLIDHDAKDYFISNKGRVKSRYKREYFARKTAKRERLVNWVDDGKTESFTIKNKSIYIFHSTKVSLMKKYFDMDKAEVKKLDKD